MNELVTHYVNLELNLIDKNVYDQFLKNKVPRKTIAKTVFLCGPVPNGPRPGLVHGPGVGDR